MTDPIASQLTNEECEKRGFLSRAEFAKEVGVTVDEIRRREQLGELIPVARGHWKKAYYSKEQVVSQRLRPDQRFRANSKLYTSHDAQRVFKALSERKTVKEIIMEGGIHPNTVQEIAREYYACEGGIYVTPEEVALIEKLPLEGTMPITSGLQLYEMIRRATEERCHRCKKRNRELCKRCALAMTVAREREEEG